MKKNMLENDWQNSFTVEPLTRQNWDQFTALFGERGACGNCWCMYFRLDRNTFAEGKVGGGNRQAMKDLVWAGQPAGLLGLVDGQAIAWCAFAPRTDFPKLSRSRVHKPIDDKLVWSVPCLFIDKKYRREGVSVSLLKGAVKYAAQNGIKIIEAYPTIPTRESLPDSFAWVGLFKSFERAGFRIVDQTSRNRPMVRYYI